jgi:hypothetical protein
MNEQRRQILQMLAEGKISADEAERLIVALEKATAASAASTDPGPKSRAKYLRVQVDAAGDAMDGPSKVNVRVPLQLLRAGVKLAGLIPAVAMHHVNDALRNQGVPVDLSQIKPENLEELVEQLNDLTVDVDQNGHMGNVKVKVFCE